MEKKRISNIEFEVVKALLNVSDKTFSMARLALVDGLSYTQAAEKVSEASEDGKSVSRQSVNKAANRVLAMLARYREAQAIEAKGVKKKQ